MEIGGEKMKNKVQFLTLEDSTVHLLDDLDSEKMSGMIPNAWIEIMKEEKEIRCNAIIVLWKKYLGDKLPNVISRFEVGMEDVELLERDEGGEKKYSLLYSIINEEGRCIYYEGRNPLDNVLYRSKLDFWNNLPLRIRNFYENIHDGFYHYMNRGMGLQPLKFTRFMEPDNDELEWNLNYEGNEEALDGDSHVMAFFWNSLGIAVSMDDSDESEYNSIIWRNNSPCEFHADFWNIVDQLLLYF